MGRICRLLFFRLCVAKKYTPGHDPVMRHLTTFRTIDEIARTGSIRAAAEVLSQTPSAVQRRLQGYEDELGYAIFERTSRGVRLNTAGELAILHIRETLAETERLHSRIADLTGVRRGRVAIGCSQALAPYFLPREISRFQAEFPDVTFSVEILEHTEVTERLEGYGIDLGIVFDERNIPDYKVLMGVPQSLNALMARDHPLARHPVLRLRQCYAYPVMLPVRGFGGRALIERALVGKTFVRPPVLESNSFELLKAHVARSEAITFQIRIGAPDENDLGGLVSRPLDPRDVSAGTLFVGQKWDRALPVAVSKFAEQLTRSLSDEYGVQADGAYSSPGTP
jgi:DNA-binding transcriptional LysR family regulator